MKPPHCKRYLHTRIECWCFTKKQKTPRPPKQTAEKIATYFTTVLSLVVSMIGSTSTS